MKRIASIAAGLFVTATALSSAFAGPFVLIEPNVAKQVGAARELPRIRDTVRLVCPDLKVIASQHELHDGSIRITIKVTNASTADYVSGADQQMLVIRSQGGRSDTLRFGSLRRGEEVRWGDTFRPFEFPATYDARIAFDPDIRVDGNPLNDDCRASNNQAALTTAR